MNLEDTISSLKSKIKKIINLDEKKFYLSLQYGKIISDESLTLKDYNIHNDDIIYLRIHFVAG